MIRPYTPADKQELLVLLKLNTPLYIAETEEADFIEPWLKAYTQIKKVASLVQAGFR